MSKLPFDFSNKSKVKITESVEPIKPRSMNGFDDDVDDSLLRLAGLKD